MVGKTLASYLKSLETKEDAVKREWAKLMGIDLSTLDPYDPLYQQLMRNVLGDNDECTWGGVK